MNTTKLFYFGAGIAFCAGCLAWLLTLDAEESFVAFCVGVAGLLLAFGTNVYDVLSYRARRKKWMASDEYIMQEKQLASEDFIMQDEELETQGSWGVDSDLSDTAKEV